MTQSFQISVIKFIFLFLVIISPCKLFSATLNLPYYGDDTLSFIIPEKPLFTSNEVLDLKIYFNDLKKLRKDVSGKHENHYAVLTFHDKDGFEHLFDLKITTRGNFRQSPANCNFPPLRLNFVRSQLNNTLFEGQNKLKLVTHCNSNQKEFEQYVLQEYLAYRLYNILTDKSLRVRLTKISYIDNLQKSKPLQKYGFLIEDSDDMAGRNGYREVKLNNIPLDYTDYFYQNLLSVFQYMIGNTDWSVLYTHNIKLIMEKPDSRPIPIPYDFDWCGMVNPIYAVPSYKLGIKSVEERIYRGYERPMEDFKIVFDYIESKKEEIYSLYTNSLLSDQQKARSIKYLDEFFQVISDDELIMKEFIEVSRKFRDNPVYGK